MIDSSSLKCEIKRKSGIPLVMSPSINGGEVIDDCVRLTLNEQKADGCIISSLDLKIDNHELSECNNLEAQSPLRVFLPLRELPQSITALYMFSPWWSRPAFVQSPEDIPDKTQAALFRFRDKYACFVPMVGERFKAYLSGGTGTELQLIMTALQAGLSEIHEPLYVYAEARSIFEAINKAFKAVARMKNIRLRTERRYPEIFRWLGWCSWNAFYTEVSEEGIRRKAEEFAEKKLPVKWVIIDDGWLSLKDRLLYDYLPDRAKFPGGFARLTKDIREKTDIKWFGVWHAMMGYWSGISPEGSVARQEAEYLCRTAGGRLVPDPERGSGFYDDWYRVLNEQGIDFVKVDGQGTIPLCFENTLPVGEAAGGLHRSLENGLSRMDGAVINCMGMSMENILSRPATAVSRNSDDFFPDKPESFAEHLLENAYNALYHDQLYYCDWDMFWTKHPDSVKHALLRAISGGPVYFSDKVGETDPDILKPLAYSNGELLMMDGSAKPTEDCVFADPLKRGYLKLQNTARYGENMTGGGIAVYNLSDNQSTCTVSPSEIEGLTVCDRYLVLDYFSKKTYYAGLNDTIECTLEKSGYRWFVILPVKDNCVCLGLIEKYVGFTAVEGIFTAKNSRTVILHETGKTSFAVDETPKRITVNGVDITACAERNGNIITLPLEEKAERAVIVLDM